MPSLIIDGSDILAKWKPEAFTMLVEKAKASANEGTLRIVLVSSEGHIMPLVDGTSSRSRVENIVEVLDISREEGMKYLESGRVPSRVASEMISYAGLLNHDHALLHHDPDPPTHVEIQ